MLTQLMPAMAQAMQGISSDQAARQLMQALGNCGQPLAHRGPVAVAPGPRGGGGALGGAQGGGSAAGLGGAWGDGGGGFGGRGVYADQSVNLFGDSFPWNPTTVFTSNFSNLQNHFAYNAPGNAGSENAFFANTIDSRWFSDIFRTVELFQSVSNYDNRSFSFFAGDPGPSPSPGGPGFFGSTPIINLPGYYSTNVNNFGGATNNHFGGDNFLFNNDIQFATNIFPTEIVLGQPGAPGPAGPSGLDGVAGLSGLPGRDGVDGQAGLDGRAGDAGRNGLDGAAGVAGAAGAPGRPGVSLRGAPGLPGRSGVMGQRGPAGPPGLDGVLRVVQQGGGQGGGYFLKPGGPVKIDPTPPTAAAEPFTVSVTVPTYEFDSESCKVIESGSQVITSDPITLKINVTPGFPTFALPDPPPELLPKATYP
jgi:hypothetical protein